MSAANLIERKGIQYVIQALNILTKKFDNLKYLVIGDGPYRNELERLSRGLGLEDHIVFVGQKPHQETMQLMAACDIFVLPAVVHDIKFEHIAAMANSKPVIGCEGEGIEDFVVDSKTGFLVKPKDVEDLVNALDDLLDHPQKGIEAGIRAQKHVLENYTWEKNAQKTIQVYKEALDDF